MNVDTPAQRELEHIGPYVREELARARRAARTRRIAELAGALATESVELLRELDEAA